MLSPSKQQSQQQQQQNRKPSREYKSDQRASYVRIKKGLKPLEKKSFYLDIKNHALAAKLEAKIKELGGGIELFLVRSVTYVVTDRLDKAGYTNTERPKWGCTSGGSGGLRSLRSVEVATPTPTPPTPLLSSECPSSNSISLRVSTTQRSKSRVDAMLERALIQPQQCSVDLLDNAQSWGIPIWPTDKFNTWLENIYESFNLMKEVTQLCFEKDIKIKNLKGPYVKFESYRRTARPVFLELSAWPTLNFDGDPGSCPFDTKKQGKLESKLISKAVKENKKNIEYTNKEEQDKEMTRRPRATAARARRTEQLIAGYCEICNTHYDDLTKHMQSEQHVNFVQNNDNFLSLDRLINAGANVDAFLKLNSTKDIEKDCNLFPNEDNNLHNVLPNEKLSKNSKTLSSFSVDEIKMVQCNGARRNLNLKLSSPPPHNLRARTKHESGHLLRSKGSPWHEVYKSDKLYDKLEGFTIKKRSKGTIWIEEEDPDDKYEKDILKESKQDYKIKSFSKDLDDVYHADSKEDNISSKHSNLNPPNLQQTVVRSQNCIINSRHISEEPDYLKSKDPERGKGDENSGPIECTINENCAVDNNFIVNCKVCKEIHRDGCALQVGKMTVDARKFTDESARVNTIDVVCNGHNGKSEQKELKASQGENTRHEKPKQYPRANRRGGRNIRGRHRLSVEERLIEDNRAYYKVEVLGNKLRSSAIPGGNMQQVTSKDEEDEEKKEEAPSSEKPVVVRFKRVRKSELTLLSDEAESFMFGEPKRDDSIDTSDGDPNSLLPKDTESEFNENTRSSSPLLSSSPVKQEIIEEDSQDSVHLGRARKRRRTQAEAFIKDNADYYKFETPGSRLRYQAPLTGIKDAVDNGGVGERAKKSPESEEVGGVSQTCCDNVEKIYPSKPSAEIEKMQFSFEAIPKSEPWYQTYQRQDTGAEFWHCFSENDTRKPFLLPYEIENFSETLMRNLSSRIDGKKRGRGRGIGCTGGGGRSPRKSPRCHASTLAIMSTIIRKREQQQSSTLYTIEESPVVKSRINTPKPEQQKQVIKNSRTSNVDGELKEMTRTIDEMFSAKGMTELDVTFELDEQMQADLYESSMPKGAPSNLLDLLDNCHDIINCLENSSCASSECGEGNPECPLKRRKRRKNRTGWPGNKMKRKLQSNNISKTLSHAAYRERKTLLAKKRLYRDNVLGNSSGQQTLSTSNVKLSEGADLHAIRMPNNVASAPGIGERFVVNLKSDIETSLETCESQGFAKRDRNMEIVDDTRLSGNTGNCMESSLSESTTCTDTLTDGKYYSSSKQQEGVYSCKKELSEIEEISENDPGNNENHENQLTFRKDVGNTLMITERNFIAKSSVRKRGQREHTTTAELACAESRTEIENQDNLLCRKDTETGIVPRKHHSNELSPKRQQQQQQRRGNSENADATTKLSLLEERHHDGVLYRRRRVSSRRRIYSRKRQSRPPAAASLSSSDVAAAVYEDENCKKDSYLSITCKKQPAATAATAVRVGIKRKSEAISSESVQESDAECGAPLSERISPPVMSPTELEQRRSSIDFQPVVRMMKLDDQVDIDHSSILSVTVASNRRLRSSGSTRTNTVKQARKRHKSSRGQFGRWLKNS